MFVPESWFIFVCFILFGFRATPEIAQDLLLALLCQESLPACSGDHMGCQGWSLSWLRARPVPSPLSSGTDPAFNFWFASHLADIYTLDAVSAVSIGLKTWPARRLSQSA